jgi:Icc-related predicted phosphoesterase
MRLAVHSDLHLEMQDLPEQFLFDESFDVLILAGDIVDGDIDNQYYGFGSIRDVCPNKPILFVPGNHEYYDNHIDYDFTEICDKFDVQVLNNRSIDIQGVNFVGSTLWTNMESVNSHYDDFHGNIIRRSIADFSLIRDMSLDKMRQLAKEAYEFLEQNITKDSVVITHFSPLLCLGNQRFPITDITAYFQNEYPELFYLEPKAWIYGHTHGNVAKQIYNTPVYTNQHGYKRECAGVYNPNFIVEI